MNITIDNIVVNQVEFQQQSGNNGAITINPKIKVKLIDFSVSELFLEKKPTQKYECNKYNLSFHYEQYVAPNIHDCDYYDAKAIDMWAFGMVIYFCFFNQYPYKTKDFYQPQVDSANYAIITGKLKKYLITHNLSKYINSTILSLVTGLLNVNESHRFNAIDVLKHKWFASYAAKYWSNMQQSSLMHKEKLTEIQNDILSQKISK